MVASSKWGIQKCYSLEVFKIGMFRTNCETCNTFVGVSSLLWVPVGKNYSGTYSFGVGWMKTKIDQKWPKQHPDHRLQANITLFKSIYRKIKKVLTLLSNIAPYKIQYRVMTWQPNYTIETSFHPHPIWWLRPNLVFELFRISQIFLSKE